MTINLNPIVETVRAVRQRLAEDTASLADRILAGSSHALTFGSELVAATDRLVADLGALVDDTRHADHLQVEHCLGIDAVIDAVLIATGEQESDDAEVNERFRPVRLERQRAGYEQSVRDLRSLNRPLTADEKALARPVHARPRPDRGWDRAGMTEATGYSAPLTAMTAADRQLVEAFTTYQTSRAFSPNTVNRRRLSLCRFATHMAPASITAATPADIDDWTAKLRSPATKHAYRSDLSTFFRWAARRGLVDHNPVLGTDSVRRPKALPKPAKAESITAAFTVAPPLTCNSHCCSGLSPA